ncbi:MAG: hypothetical protein AAFN41_13815, partial [Planctomycetota bacterium]
CTGPCGPSSAADRCMHRSCFEKAEAAKSGSDQRPKGTMDALLADVAAPEEPATKPCVNCGMPKPADAVACSICKFDEQLGRVPKEPKASKKNKQAAAEPMPDLPGSRLPMSIGAAVSAVKMDEPEKQGLAVNAWLVSAACASVVALGCALAWGATTYYSGWEFPIAALGVGFLVGLGAVIGVRSHAGFVSGLIAGVLTLASVFGGKYFAASWVVDDFIEAVGSVNTNSVFLLPLDPYNGWMTDEQALAYAVDHECRRREHKGIALDWPTPADPDNASDLDWYPQDVVAYCTKQWEGMGPEDAAYAKYELATEAALVYCAAEAAPAFAMRGVSADYPRGHTADTAYFVEDYPLEVQTAAQMRWNGMTPEKQAEFFSDRIGAGGWMDAETKADMAMSLMLANERPEAYQPVGNIITGTSSETGSVRGWAGGVISIILSFFVAWGVGCGGKN